MTVLNYQDVPVLTSCFAGLFRPAHEIQWDKAKVKNSLISKNPDIQKKETMDLSFY